MMIDDFPSWVTYLFGILNTYEVISVKCMN